MTGMEYNMNIGRKKRTAGVLFTTDEKNLMCAARDFARETFIRLTHYIGEITGRFYFEDFVRVYPDQVVFSRFGRKLQAQKHHLNNYLNHRKAYHFAAQFVKDKLVLDAGCGSGYGCEILSQAGARRVFGCDISKHALRFAQHRYGNIAQFNEQGITDLHSYADSFFDVTISSEVLEHIKEYKLEDKAIKELKRVTREDGVIVVFTPNTELLPTHGFSFEEIYGLFRSNFDEFCIFENALIPFGEQQQQIWKNRVAAGRTGVIVSQKINFSETLLSENDGELKVGLEQGRYCFGNIDIDTTLLHNAYSWVAVARK
jgi:SAM-dependent methyltransferase